MNNYKMLFAPGPVNTSERVKNVLKQPDICHRSRDFEKYFSELRNNILRIFNIDSNVYTSVVVSGSGTASNETVLSSVVPDGKKVLLISNGEFGYRLENIIDTYKLDKNHLEFGWGNYPDLNLIEDTLKKDKDISLVAMVYHETSTGMINPVYEVGELAKRYNKRYFVDVISAVGGEDIDLIKGNIDYCTGVPNKSVAGLPGVSFVCIKNEVIDELKEIKPRNVYLDLKKHIEFADKYNQTPNTPSVYMMLALNEALKELLEEGLVNRIKRYRENAGIIREGLRKMGLKFLLNDEKIMSTTVTSVFLPENIDAVKFVEKMDEEGYVIYLGKGPLLKENMIQVANMGQIYPKDCKKFIEKMEEVINNW